MAFDRLLPRAFLLLFGALLALGVWQWRGGAPVSANLFDLIPDTTPSRVEQRAIALVDEPLSRELLVLIGHVDRDQAIESLQALQRAWEQEVIFDRLESAVVPDLAALRQQLLAGRLAYLPRDIVQRLKDDPQGYVNDRAAELMNVFGGVSLVPAHEDWLGLTGQIVRGISSPTRMQPDLATGILVSEADGKYWAMLRAHSRSTAFDTDSPKVVADLVDQARSHATARGSELLALGGMMYSAAAADQARHEMTLMGGFATLGSLLLLLGSFRRWRALLVFVPVGVGAVSGTVVCVAVFGKIHVLTMVLGMSLTGVTIDYAMHYLSKSFTLRPWDIRKALFSVVPGLTLSVVTSSLGYLTLAWAPFPALRQVAVFSIAGLVSSYLCAVCLLPALLKRFEPVPHSPLLTVSQWLIRIQTGAQRFRPWTVVVLLAGLVAGGVFMLKVEDNLRNWVSTPPALQAQAERVSAITGYEPTSQFFLVSGASQDALLTRHDALTRRLDDARAAGKIRGYLALNQLVRTGAEQRQAADVLTSLAGRTLWQPLAALGVSETDLRQEIDLLQALPPVTALQALEGPLGTLWRGTLLQHDANGWIGLVRLQGRASAAELTRLAQGLPGVTLVDRVGTLSAVFAATRETASWLVGLASVLMGALLCAYFGWRSGLKILLVPLAAIAMSLGVLGYLGEPLTLFVLFGLILVLTIGVDYAIFMYESVSGRATTLAGVILDAATTLLSFGLLALSDTPAVRSFGLSVGLGIAFCFLLAPWTGRHTPMNLLSRRHVTAA